MRALLLTAAIAGSLAIGVAEAAPGPGVISGARPAASEDTAVEKAYWVTRCYWHNRHRRCYNVWVNPAPRFFFQFGPRYRYRRWH